MSHDAISAAIDVARPCEYPSVRAALYRAIAAGQVTNAQADALEARLLVGLSPSAGAPLLRARHTPGARRRSIFKPRRRPPPRDKEKSMRRRRYHAQGALPPSLCQHFTTGQLAVLAIVGQQFVRRGRCEASIEEIAARAGCGKTLVRYAIAQAEHMGLLHRLERPVPGQPSLTNALTIISEEWLGWIGCPAGGGSRPGKSTKIQDIKKSPKRPFQPFEGHGKGAVGRQDERRPHADPDDGDVTKRNLRSLR